MNIRRLTDGDLAALLRYLAPTEAQSLFLVGNAQQHGIDDRGGPLNGRWVGAFDGDEIAGVAAWFRGFESIAPACGGHAAELLPLLIEGLPRPRVVLGTAERVAEVVELLPWTPTHRQLETHLVLHWADFAPMHPAEVRQARLGEEEAVADAVDALHIEGGMPTEHAVNRASAERNIAAGNVQSVWSGDRLLALSTEGAASGRYVHVGATWCASDARRRGLAGSCVTAVVERARAAGRAAAGAALFTGRDNLPALRLYERLGFRFDADWEMAFLR